MNYFTVQVINEPRFERTFLAETRGKAKYQFLRDLWEAWGRDAVSFAHLRVLPTGRATRPPIAKGYYEKGRAILRADITRRIVAFLDGLPAVTKQQWEHSYPLWAQDTNGWRIVGMGGTNIVQALVWFHHTYEPGSIEHRAAVILAALIKMTEEAKG